VRSKCFAMLAVSAVTRPVQTLGETRLAVALHRLLTPDGSALRLDQFIGLNQIGDAGLRDKVNHHYWSTFGSAAAVGLISGLAQWIGTAGLSGGTGDRTVIIAGGADAAASTLTGHDTGRWTHARRWITALNSGDAIGAAYLATATPLAPPNAPGRLSAAARRAFERQYATVEITDSVTV